MSELITVIAAIAVVGYVIGRQLVGEPLRGKRVVLLPAILTVVGVVELRGHGHHLQASDVGCLVVGGLLVAAIGFAQGSMLRLEARNGALWGQLPVTALWLWAALVASRLLMMALAHGVGAQVAASSATILLMLGINRLAQAASVVLRAMSAGIPFAAEKDGNVFMAGLLRQR